MDNSTPRFFPGSAAQAPAMPLARYLPPLPDGMAAAWLAENVPPGSWLLDPLGASPALALEAARAGYRVLVACNNPILRFLIETLAAAPRSADFQSALAELAAARRGEERLEVHLRRLYQTSCDSCGETVEALAFLWRKGESQPFARLYECPRCGESGERPVIQADLDRLAALGGDRLQRARALQRVIMDETERREDVEEALENYLTRPLYVLFTLLNKLEGLGAPPDRQRLLQALLISTFDAGSTLWPYPGGRARPKQLTVPPQFRENNLWRALEDASLEWAAAAAWFAHKSGSTAGEEPLTVTAWPVLPPPGGICLFRGRVKALMPLPEETQPAAVLTVFPRPSQAFWTLSVLWTGWLWGAEAALPLRNVLDRRRYDWNWHTSAIHSALAAVGWNIPPETPVFGLLPELAPGFLSAVAVASAAAGFWLEGFAIRPEQELAQAFWRPQGGSPPTAREHTPEQPDAALLEIAAREAMHTDLMARGEPAPYLIEYSAGLTGMLGAGAVPRSLSSVPGDLLTRVQAVLARTFADRSFLRLVSATARPQAGPGEEERGAWWLANISGMTGDLPLADRVEIAVVRFLQKQADCTPEELDRAICAAFPMLLTPPVELVRACLESYGELVPGQAGRWRLPAGESPAARKADLAEMRDAIRLVGERLGYPEMVERGGALAWKGAGKESWLFYCMASSIISRYVLGSSAAALQPARRVLVLPGSRARLLAYKLHRDPYLEAACRDWRFLKFRHLREIAAREDLDAVRWQALLDEDPLTDEATQMKLFADMK